MQSDIMVTHAFFPNDYFIRNACLCSMFFVFNWVAAGRERSLEREVKKEKKMINLSSFNRNSNGQKTHLKHLFTEFICESDLFLLFILSADQLFHR